MQVIRYSLVLASLWLAAAAAQAEGAGAWYPGFATNDTALTARVQIEGGAGLKTIRRAYVNAGTNRMAFVVPDGFRLESTDATQAVLVSSAFACQIRFRLLDSIPLTAGEPDAAACRQSLLDRCHDATILEEASRTVNQRTGPVINLRWNGAGHIPLQGSFVFLPYEGQVIELSLVASPEKLNLAWPDFHLVLLTFRASDKNGRLAVPMLSDKI